MFVRNHLLINRQPHLRRNAPMCKGPLHIMLSYMNIPNITTTTITTTTT